MGQTAPQMESVGMQIHMLLSGREDLQHCLVGREEETTYLVYIVV